MSSDTDEVRAITDIGGVDEETATLLRQAGYRSVEDLRGASEEDLAAADGIRPAMAARIKAELGNRSSEQSSADPDTHGGHETAEWTPAEANSTAIPETPPYFEETLRPQVPGDILGLMLGFAVLLSGGLLSLILLFVPLGALFLKAVGIALASAAAFGALWGAVIHYRMRVIVTVSNTGIEVVRNWNSRRGADQVTVPFESLTSVHTTDDIGPHVPVIEREYADEPTQAYMVTTGWLPGVDVSYQQAVRIERANAPPVYLGSSRPRELGAIIAQKIPDRTRKGPVRVPDSSGVTASIERAERQSEQADHSDEEEQFDGTIPGASKKRERRGIVFVILFAIGMIVAIEGFGTLGVLAFLGVLGVLCVVAGAKAWFTQRRQLTRFEPTTGLVIATKTVDLPRNRRRPLVKYEYTVNGESFENDKIWPGGPMAKSMGPRTSHNFLSEYPEGEQTTVYYDPQNPGDAFIDRSSTTHWFVSIFLVGLGILVYLALLFIGVAPPPDV